MKTNLGKATIMIVDDEAILLMSLKMELKKQFKDKFDYESAINAEEALLVIDEMVQSGTRIILIISDWMMPGIKGDELLVIIHEKYPEIQSIMITGHSDVLSFEKLKSEAGTYAIIPKPWDRKQLIEAINTCCAEV